ncbi:MAG TPA: hypothetical protein HA282_04235 [Nanoarchaeota archaeon]|nr:hypothetical protein [Nanoarchaeota archaeon]HIH33724.1 hypothetical protein [Nanoarchaeota archaeon]HIH51183.1 hypothetical protein [Nanoarchaeota archaeon]HIH66395.1 hypothetical protein [Nanoarchaeota archaeon]
MTNSIENAGARAAGFVTGCSKSDLNTKKCKCKRIGEVGTRNKATIIC